MKSIFLSFLAALSISMTGFSSIGFADAAVSTGINAEGPSWPIGGHGWRHSDWNNGWRYGNNWNNGWRYGNNWNNGWRYGNDWNHNNYHHCHH